MPQKPLKRAMSKILRLCKGGLMKSIQPSSKKPRKKMPRFIGVMKPDFAMIAIMAEAILLVGKLRQLGYQPGVNGLT